MVVPITLALIFLLLYLNFRKIPQVLIVMLSLPFALVGGVWLMWLLDYNLSVASAIGFIALAGVAAETGVVMLIYLDQAREELRKEGKDDLLAAIRRGAVDRVRPKMMTVAAIIAGLLPIMWGSGTGSEIMRRIAAPMVGGGGGGGGGGGDGVVGYLDSSRYSCRICHPSEAALAWSLNSGMKSHARINSWRHWRHCQVDRNSRLQKVSAISASINAKAAQLLILN